MKRWQKITLGAVILALVLAVFLWRISKSECFQLAGDVTCRVVTQDKVVALSFDDGPTPEGVDAVLPELEKRGIKATFFLIGNRMEKFPGQAQRLLAAGHELGNHSYSHVRMWWKTPDFYDREIAKTDRLLREAGVEEPKLFRPPFGKRLIGLPLAVERAGYHMVTWDIADDVKNNPSPRAYAGDILDQVKPGSIILIHPMYHGNKVEREALPLVLDGLKTKGYRIVTVGALLSKEKAGAK